MAPLISQELGTWASVIALVGIPVAIIALLYQRKQFHRESFDPEVTATIDDSDRIHVSVHNKGAGQGEVSFVRLFAGHVPGEETEVLMYYLERAGKPTKELLKPFPLPGRQTAHLILIPDDELNPDHIREGRIKIDVEFGGGRSSGCVDVGTVRGHDPGTTHLPEAR